MKPRSLFRNCQSLELAANTTRTRRSLTLRTQQSPPKDPMRATVMASIKKAVRNNDIGLLIQQRQRIRTEPPESTDFIGQQMHNTLVNVRKRYDQMKRERVKLGHVTQKLQRQAKNYSQMQTQEATWIQSAKKSHSRNKVIVETHAYDMQMLTQGKKVYVQMKERLIHDKTFYKNQITKCKQIVRDRQFERGQCEQTLRNFRIEAKDAENMMEKLKSLTRSQKMQRMVHLEQVETAVQEKNWKQMSEKTRTEFENETAEKTLLSRNEEEQSWINLMQTHLFLKDFLKDKIFKEMQKFQIVQNSFVSIRARTEVKTPQELVHKFLHRTQIYDNLLDEVARLKKKRADLKQQETHHLREYEMLVDEKQELENAVYLSHIRHFTEHGLESKVEKWHNRAQQNQTIKNNLEKWVRRLLIKLKVQEKEQKSLYRHDHLDQTQYIILKLKTLLNKIAVQVEGALENVSIVQQPEKRTKNIERLAQHLSAEQQKQLSILETEILDEDNGGISGQREAILLKNSRFMKEVRARHKSAKLRTIEKDVIKK